MLPLQNRIRKNPEYKRIYKAGNKFYSKYFTVIIADSPQDSVIRFGIVASKKVGNAVVRNKLKRQAREILKQYLTDEFQNKEIVIILKAEAAEANFQELQTEITNILNKEL
ncbi:ribonuclease P protein component [Candidatus Dojkabacteria bacterium]|uniref:Ribonuclease P protein component n=1 Tax=Candidatus Dojkabacteria bacterium TaxID=2099670 RepID=A0A955RJ51_9BACT|nr:ribonuclease P protein component [Candidatus Dojkabacteria bacterium]